MVAAAAAATTRTTIMSVIVDSSATSSPELKHKISCRSPVSFARSRSRRCRQSRTGTAVIVVVALLISSTAWLSLVFSGATGKCLHRFRNWERSGGPRSLPLQRRPPSATTTTTTSTTTTITTTTTTNAVNRGSTTFDHRGANANAPPPPRPHSSPCPSTHNRTLSEKNWMRNGEELAMEHILFGIAGSSQLWERRKEFVRLWWRSNDMRGFVWLEEEVAKDDWDESLPPIMISEDTSRFSYTNPTGHPSGLRISRIILESFRLGLPDVRWFVLGDDDTIFSADNLLAVLSKYDDSEMVYIGSPSESHSANTYFSHNMAYGGGGIAISYPLAEALSNILDECLERYHSLYGSDDRLHACISELGVPLTREHGFHQWDIRGNAHGLLSSHPIVPFVSIHHVEAVDPFYPGLSTLDSLKRFTKAMAMDPMSLLQRSICYDSVHHLSFSVSLGYVIQVFPNTVLPRALERSELTYSAWNKIFHRNEFDLDTKDADKSDCKKPINFFLKDVARRDNVTVGSYERDSSKDDLKKNVFCFPHWPSLPYLQNIRVVGYPLRKNWHLVPRRLCCKLNQTRDEVLTISVRHCERGSYGSVTDSL